MKQSRATGSSATTPKATSRLRRLSSFPNPVNEVSARLVAAGVVLMALALLATGWRWIVLVLAYGFVARVLSGPTLSPLGQLVTRVVTPALPVEPKYVPGPPKRFAQGIGATLTVTAAILTYGFDAFGAAKVLVAAALVAATLESVFAYCVGCKVFGLLMRIGLIPESVCEHCNDIWANDGNPRTRRRVSPLE
ncbi:MAG TPA: DUF4395 domain-containing protein [Acidimicrobiia bacterium]|nr:DUF4395 domain-containing protein [Acidimicrobiia bacterium]